MKTILFILISVIAAAAGAPPIVIYDDGTPCYCDSLVIFYHGKGRPAIETPYKNGVRNGEERIYYKRGMLRSRIPYKDDLIDGYAIKYWRTGEIWQKSRFIKGIRESFTIQFFEDGTFAGQALFKNGELVGQILCTDGRRGDSLDEITCAPGDDGL